jgi:putative transposase
MANTYSKIYLHFVFAVKNRISLVGTSWKTDLYKYITGIVANHGHKVYSINGMPDHVHILVSMSPKQSPSELMHDVKRSSSTWINENKLVVGKFAWQEGFGVFSYSESQVDTIVKYINEQEKHHKIRTFQEEYIEFLKLFNIEYDERYTFKEIE